MAAPNLGQVGATVFEKVVSRDPADNVFKSWLILKLLKENDGFAKEDGGAQIEEPLEYAENTTFRSFSDLETLDTTRIDVFDAARFPWKEVGGTIVFSEIEKNRAQGESAKIDLVARKVENGKNSAYAVINRMFYGDGTGNGGKDIGGLALLVSSTPTVGTVGGINRGLFSFWRNRQVSGTKTTTAFDNLRGAMRSQYNSCSKGANEEQPQWIVFDQTSLEGYESTLVVNERFTTKDEGNGGFKNDVLKFKTAKVTFDEDMPAATGFTLNGRNLKFRYLTWMKTFPPVDPANQFADITKVLTQGNMSINNPRRLGVITFIS